MQQLEQCYKEDKYCGGIRRYRVLHLALFCYNALAFGVGGGGGGGVGPRSTVFAFVYTITALCTVN
jgi:hypothetical protein